jgi:hypothetical protein
MSDWQQVYAKELAAGIHPPPGVQHAAE